LFFPEVRSERKARGWTQRQLAVEAGLSLPTVIAAEASRNISFESAYRIAVAFEKSPAPMDESTLEVAQA